MRTITRLLFAFTIACTADTGGTSDLITEFPPDPLDAIDATPDPTCTATWAVGGRGQIVDELGNPVAGARPQMCLRSPTDVRDASRSGRRWILAPRGPRR